MIDLPLRHVLSSDPDVRRAQILRGNAHLLDLPARQGLHARGWDHIHQSGVATYRTCPASLGFQLRVERHQEGRRLGTINMLAGSLFHEAVAYPDSGWFQVDWWVMLAHQVRERHPETVYLQDGRPMSLADVRDLARRMLQPFEAFGGKSMANLGMATKMELEARHYDVLGMEESVSYRDGDDAFPVYFVGTLDFPVRQRRNRRVGVLDLKTYGLLDTVLGGKAPKAQRPGDGHLRFNSQLRHYAMLMELVYRTEVRFVGHVYPANLCPQLTGPEKGKPKGQIVRIEDLMEGDVAEYRTGLLSTLRQAAGPVPWAKTFPEYFGAPACVEHCSSRELCYRTDPGEESELSDLFTQLSEGTMEIT